jgi:hypothetical protein
VLLVEVELNLELVSATIHHQQMEVQIVSVVQADHNLATHKTVQRVRQIFNINSVKEKIVLFCMWLNYHALHAGCSNSVYIISYSVAISILKYLVILNNTVATQKIRV